MKNETKIAVTDGSCPFSVSSNLNIEVTSFDLELDGLIVRYGSASGFKSNNLIAPFHAFLMNAGENDINWEITKKNGETKIVTMNKDHLFFSPANTAISRVTQDYYQFILILIDPKKMISSANTVEKEFELKEIFNIPQHAIEEGNQADLSLFFPSNHVELL